MIVNTRGGIAKLDLDGGVFVCVRGEGTSGGLDCWGWMG